MFDICPPILLPMKEIEKTQHERMAEYYGNLKDYRIIAKGDHGPKDLALIDNEILRIESWLLRPSESPKEKHHGFHACALRNRAFAKIEKVSNPKRYFL